MIGTNSFGMKRWGRAAVVMGAVGAAGALAGTVGVLAAMLPSCAQTPTNVPVRTFEQPKNVDVVCMHVSNYDPVSGIITPVIPPVPLAQAQCAPVATGVVGSTLPNHLFALVTQMSRGELAVVDLTQGQVVDIDRSTPGINFLPVGKLPSDVAVAPAGDIAYVGSAAPNLPAIYALPTSVMLGDWQVPAPEAPPPSAVIPQITTWPVCVLPQAPGAIAIVPKSLLVNGGSGAVAAGSDAGVGDAGAGEAGAAGGSTVTADYLLAVVLPGDSANPARVELVDPGPLLQAAGPLLPNGPDAGSGAFVPPALAACPFVSYANLAPPAAGTTWSAGPAWDDGVKYVDGGLTVATPQPGTSCFAPLPGAADAGSGPAVLPLLTSGASTPIGGSAALDTSGPRPILYVADAALPIIHRVDLSDPTAVRELPPLLATSLGDPARIVSLGQISVSPPTREFTRFLYAIDRKEGSVLIYDVSDPDNGPRVPLSRPHPSIDPFQPPDRLIFNAPAAALAFVHHDWPLTQTGATPHVTAETGLLCNPNPNLNHVGANADGTPVEQGPFEVDPPNPEVSHGAYYRNNAGNQQALLGPLRLRGVFAFVTLSNGTIVTIDVDDWDAPCRRPDPLAAVGVLQPKDLGSYGGILVGPYSAIAPGMPLAPPGDLNAYHAPLTFFGTADTSPVSLEAFFPAVAPHRPRSQQLLRNDPSTGNHIPNLVALPQLFAQGAPAATQGVQALGNPLLVPTDTAFVDPSLIANPTEPDPVNRTPSVLLAVLDAGALDAGAEGGASISIADVSGTTHAQTLPGAAPGVRFAWEDPEVQLDQDWAITYEGALPGFIDGNGAALVVANVYPDVDRTYQTLTLASGGQLPDGGLASSSSSLFCGKGVEDLTLGRQRAVAQIAAMQAAGITPPERLDHRIADYVQLADNVLNQGDPYWSLANDCWDSTDPIQLDPNGRQALCQATYGATLDPNNPSTERDFPILEAYDDHLVVGRFGPQPEGDGTTSHREIVESNAGNAPFLKLMKCCFHNQVHFNVRAASEWVAVASQVGHLHHVIAGEGGRCQPSCEDRSSLLNGRAAAVPRPPLSKWAALQVGRDNPLAFRNPMFSFFVWDGSSASDLESPVDVRPVRDMVWRMSTRGQYQPQVIQLGATTTSVIPESMRFIDSLGQLAVIDGSSQGLILIDLNTIAFAHDPYF